MLARDDARLRLLQPLCNPVPFARRALADATEPSTSAAPSTVTSISFARVDARVTEKLRERDSNMVSAGREAL